MLFSSNLFLFLFLPLAILGYYILGKPLRNLFLLLISLIFYGWGEPRFVWIMIGSITLNYLFALLIDRSKNPTTRKAFLIVDIAGNLGMLFIYKYLDFFIENINLLGLSLPLQQIVLPLGISFFTFQAMSYVIDVYRGDVPAQVHIQNVGLYVAFFPQLVAGPIVRYQTIAEQIDSRRETFDDFSTGVKRFIIGFAKKIILANNMALVADSAFGAPAASRSIAIAWMGAIAYAFQIFFDFSGYSDMAIGLGNMFGFHFLENFNYPYMSKSISEFWRRWHISLGSWFRDYVYFPLGGSRVSSKARLVMNLFVVWFLTGVWHGANWTFIFWGLMYFVLITFEKLTGYPSRFTHNWHKQVYRIFTLFCILIGWIFFRSATLADAVAFCKSMFGLTANVFWDDSAIQAFYQYRFFFLGSILCSFPVCNVIRKYVANKPMLASLANILSVPALLLLLFWSVSFIMIGSHNPFIYFNF